MENWIYLSALIFFTYLPSFLAPKSVKYFLKWKEDQKTAHFIAGLLCGMTSLLFLLAAFITESKFRF
ncbi:MAG: hypothetical protein A3E80_00225 [Chlamydiae bacterium RIFCSPHIGHO2_12_FULL_49_9]|nr:MAG: hypothetical protein A3E80_00225 [Chlamydiae bacterium RIFCSPHIGHO2_12_FULL_49_9]